MYPAVHGELFLCSFEALACLFGAVVMFFSFLTLTR